MIYDVGDEVPDFSLDSQMGMVEYHKLIDARWSLLITIRSAFDAVATTEIGAVQKLHDEFEARNISVVIVGPSSGKIQAQDTDD